MKTKDEVISINLKRMVKILSWDSIDTDEKSDMITAVLDIVYDYGNANGVSETLERLRSQ